VDGCLYTPRRSAAGQSKMKSNPSWVTSILDVPKSAVDPRGRGGLLTALKRAYKMADCGIQRIRFQVEAASSKVDLEQQVRDIIDAFILYPNDQVVFVYDLRDNVYCKMMKEPWGKDGGLWLCVPDIGQRVDHSSSTKPLLSRASRSFRSGVLLAREIVNFVPLTWEPRGKSTNVKTGFAQYSLVDAPYTIAHVPPEKEQEYLDTLINMKLCATGRLLQDTGSCWLNSVLAIVMLTRPVLLAAMNLDEFKALTKTLSLATTTSSTLLKQLISDVHFKLLQRATEPHNQPRAEDWATIRTMVLLIIHQVFVERVVYTNSNTGSPTTVLAALVKAVYTSYWKPHEIDFMENSGYSVPGMVVLLFALFVKQPEHAYNAYNKHAWMKICVTNVGIVTDDGTPLMVTGSSGNRLVAGWCDVSRVNTVAQLQMGIFSTHSHLNPWSLAGAALSVDDIDHAIAGLRCGDGFYVFDSNNRLRWGDWTVDGMTSSALLFCSSDKSPKLPEGYVIKQDYTRVYYIPSTRTLASHDSKNSYSYTGALAGLDLPYGEHQLHLAQRYKAHVDLWAGESTPTYAAASSTTLSPTPHWRPPTRITTTAPTPPTQYPTRITTNAPTPPTRITTTAPTPPPPTQSPTARITTTPIQRSNWRPPTSHTPITTTAPTPPTQYPTTRITPPESAARPANNTTHAPTPRTQYPITTTPPPTSHTRITTQRTQYPTPPYPRAYPSARNQFANSAARPANTTHTSYPYNASRVRAATPRPAKARPSNTTKRSATPSGAYPFSRP
jgi:hypothetical protein